MLLLYYFRCDGIKWNSETEFIVRWLLPKNMFLQMRARKSLWLSLKYNKSSSVFSFFSWKNTNIYLIKIPSLSTRAERDWSERKRVWVDVIDSKAPYSLPTTALALSMWLKSTQLMRQKPLCSNRINTRHYLFICELHGKVSFGTAKQYSGTRISHFRVHVDACTTARKNEQTIVTNENCFRIWRYSTRTPWKLVSFPTRIV